MYRAGYFTHYAGEGSIKSAKITYCGEEVDLCLCRTLVDNYEEKDGVRTLTLKPVDIEFSDLTVTLVSQFVFEEGSGKVGVLRKIVKMSRPAEVTVNEYFTGCYGTTEYTEDMTGIMLRVKGKEDKSIEYAYRCREEKTENAVEVSAEIGAINTKISVLANGDCEGYIREGYAFSPMYTLGLVKTLKEGEELQSWLKPEKAN